MHGVGYLSRFWVGSAARNELHVYRLAVHIPAGICQHGFGDVEEIRGSDGWRPW